MRKPTLSQIIKDHLLTGKSITTMQAFEEYDITCLTTRISELKKAGLDIKQRSRISSKGKRHNLYWLEPDYIQAYKAKGGKNE